MTTPITSITSIARLARLARLARQARAFSVPVLVAGALAAGCGTVNGNVSPSAAGAKGSGTAAAAGTASSAPGSAPAASATPVPTVSGGPMIPAGGAACAGWPTNAPHGILTAFFAPVAVERCATGFEQIPGKGEWATATLEKSTEGLATLTAVLLRPTGHHMGIFCPDFAVIPPQIVLINGTGQQLIPRLPVGACGAVDAQVLSTLETMSWQPLSVRLISKVDPVAAPSASPGSPKVPRTGSSTGLMNGQPVSG